MATTSSRRRRRRRLSRRRNRGRKRTKIRPVARVDEAKITALAPLIRGVVARVGVSEGYLEDIVQETLLGAVNAMRSGRFHVEEGFNVEAALEAWVTTIAFNQARNWQKRAFNWREVSAVALRPCEEPSENPEPRYEARSVVRLAADSFPAELRAVVTLMMSGVGTNEIAVILDVPTWIVRRRMTEIRKRLTAIARGEG